MPISQQIGSSSLAKPGVCTSTTRPASPYQGQVIYETDTARTLVWNGSAWVYLSTSTANPVGLEYITQGSCSNATALDFVSVFNANYDAYRFVATSAFTSTASIHVQFQMLSGTTPITTNTYYTQRLYAQGGTVGGSGTAATAVGQGSICYLDNGTYGGFAFDVFNPYLGQETNTVSHAVYQYAGIEYHNSKHGVQASYDGLRLRTGSGTMWMTVRVYGYRKG